MTPEVRAVLGAVLALGVLQVAILLRLYATRIPALKAARIRPQNIDTAALATLPPSARLAAANYNNLFEAPTLFFALCAVAVLSGRADLIDAVTAWTYVALRTLHSLLHVTINIILWRFFLFCLSWLALAVLIANGARHLLLG